MIKDLFQGVKIKKVPGFPKDELGRKIIKEVVVFRPKTYTYLLDHGSNHKKIKVQKVV